MKGEHGLPAKQIYQTLKVHCVTLVNYTVGVKPAPHKQQDTNDYFFCTQ